jgi:hypothetical protein
MPSRASTATTPGALIRRGPAGAWRVRAQSGGRSRARIDLLRFLKGFTHFFAPILWLAAGLAFALRDEDGGLIFLRRQWILGFSQFLPSAADRGPSVNLLDQDHGERPGGRAGTGVVVGKVIGRDLGDELASNVAVALDAGDPQLGKAYEWNL